MKKVKAVFWDLDGTIADTELLGHRIAFNLAFKDFNLDWEWDVKTYIRLLSFAGGKHRIKRYSQESGFEISEKLCDEIHKRKQKNYLKIISNGDIIPRTGVTRLLKELREQNIKQWIVTTSSKNTTLKLIDALFANPDNLFNGLITSDDNLSLKPSPEAYLKVLELSDTSTHESIAIEDSLIGLKSAKAANLKCVITLSPWIKSPSKEFREADLLVDHLGENKLPSYLFKGILNESLVNFDLLNSLLN